MKVLIASREMYNSCLEELITHYHETGKHMHLYEQDKRHGKAQHPDIPAVVVDTTLKRLHRSFTHFFQGRKAGRKVGFPRFRRSRINETTASLSHYEEYTMFRLDAKIAFIIGSTLVIDGGWTAK